MLTYGNRSGLFLKNTSTDPPYREAQNPPGLATVKPERPPGGRSRLLLLMDHGGRAHKIAPAYFKFEIGQLVPMDEKTAGLFLPLIGKVIVQTEKNNLQELDKE